MQRSYLGFGASTVSLYLLIFTLWVPKYAAIEIVPYYVAGLLVKLSLVLLLFSRARWSASLLSNVSSVGIVLYGSLYVLGGFTRLDPSATAGEWENSTPGPVLMAFAALGSAVGPNTAGTGFAATGRNAWLPFVIPATYLIANAAWSQPLSRFLKARRRWVPLQKKIKKNSRY